MAWADFFTGRGWGEKTDCFFEAGNTPQTTIHSAVIQDRTAKLSHLEGRVFTNGLPIAARIIPDVTRCKCSVRVMETPMLSPPSPRLLLPAEHYLEQSQSAPRRREVARQWGIFVRAGLFSKDLWINTGFFCGLKNLKYSSTTPGVKYLYTQSPFLKLLVSLLLLLQVLLKYNSHTTQFTHWKYTIQWFLL